MSLASFQARRALVFDQMLDNSIALVSSAALQSRNRDTEYPFRQDSYFYYLTGFEESAALAVWIKSADQRRFILFCQDKNPQLEQWSGKRLGVALAAEQVGADEAYAIEEVATRLPEWLAQSQTVYALFYQQNALKLFLEESKKNGPSQWMDLRLIVEEMRLIKSEEELVQLRKACDISVLAHLEAMKQCRAGMREFELEAILLYHFYRHGCRAVAYPSIVGAGNNACILHYTQNDALLEEKQLVLIDAGGEYHNYAADITRTYPVGGKFSYEQQALYEIVLAAQTCAIESIKPGILWNDIQQIVLEVLVSGLVDLKILAGEVKTLIEQKAYLPFYMHGSGHWLGLDVHDVGQYKINNQWRPLVPGMVLTVEPGLYISGHASVAERWRGIGIRIEDDILVTPRGKEVLTVGLPKTVNEIEQYMGR